MFDSSGETTEWIAGTRTNVQDKRRRVEACCMAQSGRRVKLAGLSILPAHLRGLRRTRQ